MSILNVFITPEEGLIGVDTEAVAQDGRLAEFGKLIVAPVAGLAIGFRGTVGSLWSAAPHIASFGGTLEELVAWLPDLIKQSGDYYQKHFQAPEEHLGLDLAVVGYSADEGRVVGHLFKREVGSEDIRVDRIHTSYRSPFWTEEDLPAGIPADRHGMITLAQHQSRLARERMPELAAGGRFFIASIKQRGITIEKAFDFPARTPVQIRA